MKNIKRKLLVAVGLGFATVPFLADAVSAGFRGSRG